MEEKKKMNEELQSRREFFKNAAKGALPILGAMLFANIPVVTKAMGIEPMECSWCQIGCSGSCTTSCLHGCNTSCRGGCTGSCSGACQYSCQGSCRGTCEGGCTNGCYGVSY